MAIAKDAFVSGMTESSVATFDVNFTPGSGSNMMILVAHLAGGVLDDSLSVTYDPGGGDQASFTKIANIATEPGSLDGDLAVWKLLDASIIKSTEKVIRVATTANSRHGVVVQSYTGVDQTTPNDTATTASGDAANNTSSESITSETGDLVYSACALEGLEPLVPDSPLAEVDASLPLDITTVNFNLTVGDAAGAASVACQHSWDASTRGYYTVQFNVNQASSGGDGKVILRVG